MKKMIVITICCLLLMSELVAEPIEKELMWLPAQHSALQPYLEMAIASAQQREDCKEVLYARLNEYRTEKFEPTFTILCKIDFRSTFNIVFKITELAPDYFDRITEREQSRFVARGERRNNLNSIRSLEVNNNSAAGNNSSQVANTSTGESAETSEETEVDGEFSLQLDLGDLMLELEEEPEESIVPQRSEIF